jgi:hypothetical protein
MIEIGKNDTYTFVDCPYREEHATTRVAVCKHPDNKPPYFQGFHYCEFMGTLGLPLDDCPRGVAR